ncbi:hypothetical protein HMPREF1578_01458 [Gardnerella pickettii JCP8017B]|nr:hypothetical protein HMPREF1578_01458 [Gardnerella pickettii JCP8017B]
MKRESRVKCKALSSARGFFYFPIFRLNRSATIIIEVWQHA